MAEMNANERLEVIANKSLELIQKRIEKGPTTPHGTNDLVKETGEALKALAEGVKAFKEAMKRQEPKTPKRSTSRSQQ